MGQKQPYSCQYKNLFKFFEGVGHSFALANNVYAEPVPQLNFFFKKVSNKNESTSLAKCGQL